MRMDPGACVVIAVAVFDFQNETNRAKITAKIENKVLTRKRIQDLRAKVRETIKFITFNVSPLVFSITNKRNTSNSMFVSITYNAMTFGRVYIGKAS